MKQVAAYQQDVRKMAKKLAEVLANRGIDDYQRALGEYQRELLKNHAPVIDAHWNQPSLVEAVGELRSPRAA